MTVGDFSTGWMRHRFLWVKSNQRGILHLTASTLRRLRWLHHLSKQKQCQGENRRQQFVLDSVFHLLQLSLNAIELNPPTLIVQPIHRLHHLNAHGQKSCPNTNCRRAIVHQLVVAKHVANEDRHVVSATRKPILLMLCCYTALWAA